MVIRSGDYVVHLGKEYQAGSKSGNSVRLFSTDPEDLLNGFQQHPSGRKIKIVELGQLESAYRVETLCLYRGVECRVDYEEGATYHLRYHKNYLVAEELGFTLAERPFYEKDVPKEEVSSAWEEREPIWGFDLSEDQRKVYLK